MAAVIFQSRNNKLCNPVHQAPPYVVRIADIFSCITHDPTVLTHTKILLWRFIGLVALLLGLIGLFLPVVPTVPFMLLAAWAGSRGWPALDQFLLSHEHFGPPIRNWRETGAISRSAKIVATMMFCGSIAMVWLFPLHQHLQTALTIFMLCVVAWMWTRPDA